MKSFEYARPETEAEAVAFLGDSDSTAILAGGTDLTSLMRAELLTPTRVVDLKRMQIESNGNKGAQRPAPGRAAQLNYEFLEQIADHQDELIEDHSNQIDRLVACIRDDMSILQNLKDTRKLTSDRHH